jgi:hypothetical protein
MTMVRGDQEVKTTNTSKHSFSVIQRKVDGKFSGRDDQWGDIYNCRRFNGSLSERAISINAILKDIEKHNKKKFNRDDYRIFRVEAAFTFSAVEVPEELEP